MSDPRIGIALGGGSARGLIHIAFIEAMDELGVKPSIIAGTSIGSLIGAGWANGMSGKELREHTLDVLGSTRAISSRLWATQFRGLGKFLKDGLSMQLDAEAVIDEFVPDDFPQLFEQLKVPLFAVATDFRSWHQVVFQSGPLRTGIAGSIAIPSLFKPVEFNDQLLVDGGVVNPLPLDHASSGADILVGVDVNGDCSDHTMERTPSALDIALGSAQIMMHSITAHTMAAYPPHIYVRPNVQPFSAYEFWRVHEIIKAGDAYKERFKVELDSAINQFIGAQQKIV